MGRPSLLVVLAGVLALVAPVGAAYYLAERLARDAEFERVGLLSQAALGRAVAVGTQVLQAADRLKATPGDPCSPGSLRLMREIDLGSSYLQAVGHVEGDRLVCSSLGLHEGGVPLGPVRYVSKLGVRIRTSVALPLLPGKRLFVAERDGTAVLIHPALLTDMFQDMPDLWLGLFSASTRVPMAVRGSVRPAWMRDVPPGATIHFIDGDRVVAVRRSPKYDFVAFAAVPIAAERARVRALAWRLVPFGLLAGALLASVLGWFVRQQRSMPAMMRAALERDEFFLEYQPIVDLRTGQWVGAEALIRWKRGDGALLRPDAFIPQAEDNGLISRITERVVRMVAADAAALVARHPEFHLGINLSAADLASGSTVALLGELVRTPGFSARNVSIEATERGLLEAELVRGILREIRALGIRVAIDDFGTGYSGLSYLGTFEVDYLKIDKSFVDTVGTDAPTSDVAVHIIEMAKTLGLEMIAEGIERESQAVFLAERGVQFGQGWLFSRPLSMRRLIEELDARDAATRTPPA